VAARKPQVDAALAKWLQNTDPSFDTSSLPTLALAISGGGFRAHLIGAGITQALDERDSFSGVAGLWQAMMYQTALSGGSWMLASMVCRLLNPLSSLHTLTRQ
jgi:lysophospholipase